MAEPPGSARMPRRPRAEHPPSPAAEGLMNEAG